MRKLLYVVLGLMLFAGAAGLLYKRQMELADDAPVAAAPQSADAKSADRKADGDRTRSLRDNDSRRDRRIDRGIAQYKRPDGTWNTISAVIDVLNVVVGIVGITLALRGMRSSKA